MILRLLTIAIHIILKHLLLILLLHLMPSGSDAADSRQVVVLLVVVTLSLVVLHLEQVIVLLLRVAIGGVSDDCLSLCGLLLLLLNHVEALALGARGLQGRQLVHRSPHIMRDRMLLLLLGEGGVLLMGELVRVLLASHLWRVVTMNNGILLEVEKVVILFGVNEVAIILFDDRLLMITLCII
jgi:hypothetical protein